MIVYELCCSSLQALASERASPTSCVGGGSHKTVDSSDRQLKVPVGDLLSISHDLQVTSADLLATQGGGNFPQSRVTCTDHLINPLKLFNIFLLGDSSLDPLHLF